MTKLKSPVVLETAFGSYTVDEILGEGGAGRVYGGQSAEGGTVAVKVLSKENASKISVPVLRRRLHFFHETDTRTS